MFYFTYNHGLSSCLTFSVDNTIIDKPVGDMVCALILWALAAYVQMFTYPWWKYRHTINRNIVLKYRPIPTRIAGEEAFKNDDVTIMTSSGHATSSGSCPIDRGWPLSYTLSTGTIPLSGFVSEIFCAKVATTIKWWRHQWRHKARMNYPWRTYRHTINRKIVLKYRRIPTRIAGEETF